MAHNGKLIIADFGKDGDKDKKNWYNVQDCDYEFSQPIDNNFKPSGNTRGGLVNFTLLSNKDDLNFHNWMFGLNEMHHVCFLLPVTMGNERNNNIPERAIICFNARCIRLSEYFNNNDSETMHMRVTICSPYIQFGDKTFFVNKSYASEEANPYSSVTNQ